MKIFLDSDVLIDFLTAREPFYLDIKVIINKGINNEIKLFTSALIIANIHYFITKFEDSKRAKNKISKLSTIIKILNVGEPEILEAIKSKIKDFEDAIQNSCAKKSKIDILLTRNTRDFKHSKLAVLTPYELINALDQD